MKRIILDGNKNYYKANLHSHSTKSDGENTLSFKEQFDDVYVRFDVVDKYGKRANTNAIWL